MTSLFRCGISLSCHFHKTYYVDWLTKKCCIGNENKQPILATNFEVFWCVEFSINIFWKAFYVDGEKGFCTLFIMIIRQWIECWKDFSQIKPDFKIILRNERRKVDVQRWKITSSIWWPFPMQMHFDLKSLFQSSDSIMHFNLKRRKKQF